MIQLENSADRGHRSLQHGVQHHGHGGDRVAAAEGKYRQQKVLVQQQNEANAVTPVPENHTFSSCAGTPSARAPT